MTSYHGIKSEQMEINGGVPQESKLGTIAFIIKMNQLPSVAKWETVETTNHDDTDDGQTVILLTTRPSLR